jgi:hypothetical protein
MRQNNFFSFFISLYENFVLTLPPFIKIHFFIYVKVKSIFMSHFTLYRCCRNFGKKLQTGKACFGTIFVAPMDKNSKQSDNQEIYSIFTNGERTCNKPDTRCSSLCTSAEKTENVSNTHTSLYPIYLIIWHKIFSYGYFFKKCRKETRRIRYSACRKSFN